MLRPLRRCACCGIEITSAPQREDAGDRLKVAIKAFYDARKDRRINKG